MQMHKYAHKYTYKSMYVYIYIYMHMTAATNFHVHLILKHAHVAHVGVALQAEQLGVRSWVTSGAGRGGIARRRGAES